MWTLYSGNLEIGTITELKTYPYMQRVICTYRDRHTRISPSNGTTKSRPLNNKQFTTAVIKVDCRSKASVLQHPGTMYSTFHIYIFTVQQRCFLRAGHVTDMPTSYTYLIETLILALWANISRLKHTDAANSTIVSFVNQFTFRLTILLSWFLIKGLNK